MDPVDPDLFAARLQACSPETLDPASVLRLWNHYLELLRWNQRVSLIGPGNPETLIDRHYGESLAALPWLEPEDRVLVDVGSGAGFPGFVLAAARPKLLVTLAESRERKWAFLMAAARRAGLSCTCLNATVAVPPPPGLPTEIDLVTSRALKFSPALFRVFDARLSARGRYWFWTGTATPETPPGWSWTREVPLTGSDRRRILELRREVPS